MLVESDQAVAETIRNGRTLARPQMPYSGQELIALFNWATAPSIARSDRAHRACRRTSQWARRQLWRRGLAHHETDGGRLAFGWHV